MVPPTFCFVASRRKGSAVFYNLRRRGITFDQLKKIKTPAGLDINAKLPEEVAISILAEIIQFTRTDKPPDFLAKKQIPVRFCPIMSVFVRLPELIFPPAFNPNLR